MADVEVGPAQRDTTEQMKQLLQTREALKEKFGRANFGKLVLTGASNDK